MLVGREGTFFLVPPHATPLSVVLFGRDQGLSEVKGACEQVLLLGRSKEGREAGGRRGVGGLPEAHSPELLDMKRFGEIVLLILVGTEQDGAFAGQSTDQARWT